MKKKKKVYSRRGISSGKLRRIRRRGSGRGRRSRKRSRELKTSFIIISSWLSCAKGALSAIYER